MCTHGICVHTRTHRYYTLRSIHTHNCVHTTVVVCTTHTLHVHANTPHCSTHVSIHPLWLIEKRLKLTPPPCSFFHPFFHSCFILFLTWFLGIPGILHHRHSGGRTFTIFSSHVCSHFSNNVGIPGIVINAIRMD